MRTRSIVITESDYRRLRTLIERCKSAGVRDAEHLADLEHELETAAVVKDGQIARNVVTMNSRVRIKDLNDGREVTYQIVFPMNANIAKNRISVLAPIGTGLLGYSAGTTIEWNVPSGVRRLRIVAVEPQPEALSAAA